MAFRPPTDPRLRTSLFSMIGILGLGGCARISEPTIDVAAPTVPVAFGPLEYDCLRAVEPPPFDGDLEAGPWANAAWTTFFMDIEGPSRPTPRYSTRAKLLWDDERLYLGFELEEPDLWATYADRDMIVFHENDIEVFIDPDGDGREYYEIEVNVLGTIFDLFLHRPYREGGPAEHGWDCDGLDIAIKTDGTINQPGDRDRGWIVELAVPWIELRPPSVRQDGSAWTLPPIMEHRRRTIPRPGEVWRINFSRVQWDLEVVDGRYRKVGGRREHNWTWTPQWEINMHVPSRWGYLRFRP